MANELAIFRSFGLATPAKFAYSKEMNALTGNGYTSSIGNSYFNAVRFADGILIKEDVGVGGMYNRTFLNGLQVFDIRSHKLLAEKIYPMYGGAIYSKGLVKIVTCNLLTEMILKEAKDQHYYVSEGEVRNKISDFLDRSFAKDQLQELEKNVKALGF